MNVKQFLAILSAGDATMTLTVKGDTEGLGEGMQASAIATDKAPLFCAPKPNLGVDVYTGILQRMIKDYAENASVEELGNTQVSSLPLVGLKRAYPCKQQ
jgi:hypothetical protein